MCQEAQHCLFLRPPPLPGESQKPSLIKLGPAPLCTPWAGIAPPVEAQAPAARHESVFKVRRVRLMVVIGGGRVPKDVVRPAAPHLNPSRFLCQGNLLPRTYTCILPFTSHSPIHLPCIMPCASSPPSPPLWHYAFVCHPCCAFGSAPPGTCHAL